MALQGLAKRNAKTEEYPGPRGIECECVSPQALKLGGGSCREEGVQIHWDLSENWITLHSACASEPQWGGGGG